MEFYHREMKFHVAILYLDIPAKTTRLLHKKLLHQILTHLGIICKNLDDIYEFQGL